MLVAHRLGVALPDGVAETEPLEHALTDADGHSRTLPVADTDAQPEDDKDALAVRDKLSVTETVLVTDVLPQGDTVPHPLVEVDAHALTLAEYDAEADALELRVPEPDDDAVLDTERVKVAVLDMRGERDTERVEQPEPVGVPEGDRDERRVAELD